jgi:tetratricopeptide (TPR) repeat protein
MRLSDIGVCVVCTLPDLARAYDEAGHADSAVAAYERFIKGHDGFRYLVDWLYFAPAHKRLGELCETRGDFEKAVEYYNAFVELWQDADPELQPQVAEVRRRIARLVGEPRRN